MQPVWFWKINQSRIGCFFVQNYIFNIDLFYFRPGSRKVDFVDVYIPKRSKQGISVHCINTMPQIPLVGVFPNPPEKIIRSVAADAALER